MYPQFSLRFICGLFGKTRQGWHQWQERKEDQSLSDIIILKLVKEIRQSLPRIGTRKLLHMLQGKLQEHHIQIGRDKLYDLLGHHGLLLRYRRRKPYTTDSNHPYRKYPNLIRELLLTQSSQLWVSDITYLRLAHGFCYLSIVTDAYSRKIIGYQVHPTLAAEGAIGALTMAVRECKPGKTLIHHSDRGIQYCCGDYVKMLEHCNISISMTEKGDPYENAIAERVNGILKGEFFLEKTFATLEHAREEVLNAVDAYNHQRPHASCDYLTPALAHEQSGILRKRWKPSVKELLSV